MTTTYTVRVRLDDGDERVDTTVTIEAGSSRDALLLAELDVLAGRRVDDVDYCAVALVVR